MSRLLGVLRELRERTDSVIVAFSRGKDALAVLDLCVKHFRRVEAFHMHLVAGLSFAESHLDYVDRRYGIQIDRVPHFGLADMLRTGTYRFTALDLPRLTIRDVQARQRERTGIEWCVTGEKAIDSLQRRGMMNPGGGGVLNEKVKVAYPLAWWNHGQVYHYLKLNRIPLPADYRVLDTSFSTCIDGPRLAKIKEAFPDDYAKIKAVFPLCDAALVQHRLCAAAQAADVRRGADDAIRDPDAPTEPAHDRQAQPQEAPREPPA